MGHTFTVHGVLKVPMRCLCCGERFDQRIMVIAFVIHQSDGEARLEGHLIERVKRIPPLGELEGERQKEDIREPA